MGLHKEHFLHSVVLPSELTSPLANSDFGRNTSALVEHSPIQRGAVSKSASQNPSDDCTSSTTVWPRFCCAHLSFCFHFDFVVVEVFEALDVSLHVWAALLVKTFARVICVADYVGDCFVCICGEEVCWNGRGIAGISNEEICWDGSGKAGIRDFSAIILSYSGFRFGIRIFWERAKLLALDMINLPEVLLTSSMDFIDINLLVSYSFAF